jgi:hypothetical protein
VTDQERGSIGDYLQNVEARLAHLPSDERSAIVDNLEAQIHDALEARGHGAAATPEDVAAVLAEMDPPEAFGVEPAQPPAPAPRPGVGRAALLISLAGLLLAAIAVIADGNHRGTFLLPSLLIPQAAALIVAAFSRGDRTGRATIVLSLAILVTVTVLGLLSSAHA